MGGRELILKWGEEMCNGYVSVVRMIEVIRAIGEYAMRDRGQFLGNLCILPATGLNNQKKEFKQYMFILNFDTACGKIVCDLMQ